MGDGGFATHRRGDGKFLLGDVTTDPNLVLTSQRVGSECLTQALIGEFTSSDNQNATGVEIETMHDEQPLRRLRSMAEHTEQIVAVTLRSGGREQSRWFEDGDDVLVFVEDARGWQFGLVACTSVSSRCFRGVGEGGAQVNADALSGVNLAAGDFYTFVVDENATQVESDAGGPP
jgi:hypothetical protein